MKRLLLFLPIIFILSSCTLAHAKVKTTFKANTVIEYNELKIGAEIIAESHNMLTINVSSPESLKGYCYEYKDSMLSIKLNGLKLDAQESYIPSTGFASILNNVLKTANREDGINYSGKYNSFAVYKGKCDSGDFILTADYNTGCIYKIEIKKLNFTANFKAA